MKTVRAIEARARFSDHLNRVARGETITITRYGAAAALLVSAQRKESGLNHGEIVEGMRALRKWVNLGKTSV